MKTNELNGVFVISVLVMEIVLVAILLLSVFTGNTVTGIESNVNSLQVDSNLVLSEVRAMQNDLNQMVLYVEYSANQNYQATKFLEGCKVLQDNNSSVVLSCLK